MVRAREGERAEEAAAAGSGWQSGIDAAASDGGGNAAGTARPAGGFPLGPFAADLGRNGHRAAP